MDERLCSKRQVYKSNKQVLRFKIHHVKLANIGQKKRNTFNRDICSCLYKKCVGFDDI